MAKLPHLRNRCRRARCGRAALLVAAVALTTLSSSPSSARLNPLRYLTDQVVRPEIVIVLDNSGSMRGDPIQGWNKTTGNDCSGHDPAVDVCGDHLCSGHERWTQASCSNNATCRAIHPSLSCVSNKCSTGNGGGISCPADCTIFDDYSNAAGSPQRCSFAGSSAPKLSRMYLSKRALRNVLTDFRAVANFGLVHFRENGYFRYYKAKASAATKTVAIFQHQWELRSAGAWAQGNGWDVGGNAPKTSFTVNGVTYTRSGGSAGDSLYRRENSDVVVPKWKGWGGCSSSNKCGEYQGDCDGDSECKAGLVCTNDVGPTYWKQGDHNWSPYTLAQADVCTKPGGGAAEGYVYKRVNYAGPIYSDGSDTWHYLGSYYTYTAHAPGGGGGASGSWKGWNGCSSSNKCDVGEGDCDSNSHCKAGLVCGVNNASGYLPTSGNYSPHGFNEVDVCVPDPKGRGGTIISEFKGPEYVDGNGQRWVYHRFGSSYDGSTNSRDNYGLNNTGQGQVRVDLVEATSATPQATFDGNLGKILNRLNDAATGGLFGAGGTPTCKAIQKAHQHFVARKDGNTPFSASDVAGSCRPRFVLVISDGESSPSCTGDMPALVKQLYDAGVKTYAVTIPGIGSGGRNEMNVIADCGDDGVCGNNSSAALTSNNEKELVDNIRAVLFEAIKGQYTSSAPGVGASGAANIRGDVAIVPATEFPSWNGHLRALDLTKPETDANYELWDAGTKLAQRDWATRRLYTGSPAVSSGAALPLLSSDGAGTIQVANLKSVWPGTPPADGEITALVRWLAGKGRSWKLPALIRAVPSTVGPPPDLDGVSGHSSFASSNSARQRLVYVPSNEGLVHAFDAVTGSEMFAFLPPALLPKVYDMYRRGGQSDEPRSFRYILAASPRISDLKDAVSGWRTYLLQTYGPGSEGFVALDITSPTACSDPSSTASCSPRAEPFKVVFDAHGASPAVLGKLGEGWSLPAVYWDSAYAPSVAMASGYDDDSPNDGTYYSVFSKVGSAWSTTSAFFSTYALAGASAKVAPYAVVSNTIAVHANDAARDVLATYQSDLVGRIVRYDKGKTPSTGVSKLVDLGATQPLHLSPAALRGTGKQVTLVFASGAFQEESFVFSSSAAQFQSGGTFLSKLYARSETEGTVATGGAFTCAVNNICSASCYNGGSVVSPCVAPSARALPVSQPLVVKNSTAGGRLEAFYLFYDPPSQICVGGNVAVGDSWVIRVGLSSNGTKHTLIAVKKYANTQANGLVLVGGGTDVALAISGRGSKKAGVKLNGTLPLPQVATKGSSIESWKETQ